MSATGYINAYEARLRELTEAKEWHGLLKKKGCHTPMKISPVHGKCDLVIAGQVGESSNNYHNAPATLAAMLRDITAEKHEELVGQALRQMKLAVDVARIAAKAECQKILDETTEPTP